MKELHTLQLDSRLPEAATAIGEANSFVSEFHDGGLDGSFAAGQIGQRVRSKAEQAGAILRTIEHPNLPGYFVALSRYNRYDFATAVASLPGHMVLVPSSLVDAYAAPALYPAVVSDDSRLARPGDEVPHGLRLHVYQREYRPAARLSQAASMVLSAAAQSETAGIGDDGRMKEDGIEAEHFSAALGLIAYRGFAASPGERTTHINHKWRKAADSSVLTQSNKMIFADTVPQSTVTITEDQVMQGKVMVLWHKDMQDEYGNPEHAGQEAALPAIQAFGFSVIQRRGSAALDQLKRTIA